MPDFVMLCEQAARAGGKQLQDWVGKIQVREKGPADLVTDADLASQEAVKAVVMAEHPDFDFLGEESPVVPPSKAEYRWIVDPLDGTTNYVHQLPGYAVSVGLEQRGQIIAGAVFDPVTQDCYSAAKGKGAYLNGKRLSTSKIERLDQALVAVSFAARVKPDHPEIQEFLRVLMVAQAVRRLGSAALNLCHVAAGRLDAYWAGETKAWDVAAGSLLVEEAGGTISALNGGKFDVSLGKIAAAATLPLHGELMNLIRRGDR